MSNYWKYVDNVLVSQFPKKKKKLSQANKKLNK